MKSKSKNEFVGVKISRPFSYFAPVFYSRIAFSFKRSEQHSNAARGPNLWLLLACTTRLRGRLGPTLPKLKTGPNVKWNVKFII